MNDTFDSIPDIEYEQLAQLLRDRFYLGGKNDNSLTKVIPNKEIQDHAFEIAVRLTYLGVLYVSGKSKIDPFELVRNLRFQLDDKPFPTYSPSPFALRAFLEYNKIFNLEKYRVFIPSSLSQEIITGDVDYLITFALVVVHELEHVAQYMRPEDPNSPLNMGFSQNFFEELLKPNLNAEGDGPIETVDFSDPQTNILYHETLIDLGYLLYFNCAEEVGAYNMMLEFLEYLIENYSKLFRSGQKITLQYLNFRKEKTEEYIESSKSPDDLFERLDGLLASFYYLKSEGYIFTADERARIVNLASWLNTDPSPGNTSLSEETQQGLEYFSRELGAIIRENEVR